MTTAGILRDAKALIDTPAKWTKGVYTDDKGRRCALGALQSVTASEAGRRRAGRELERALPAWGSVTHYNDHHSHADVMALFDRAIEATERAIA
mgnify:CR=1 FL=1